MTRAPREPSKLDFSILDKAFKEIEKNMGEDVVIDVNNFPVIPRIKLSSPMVGYITGEGGLPKGRIIEIRGKESSGKSLLATVACADAQKQGIFAAYIDMEHAFSASFAKRIGLDTSKDKFRLFQPTTAEQVFSIIELLAETKQVGICVVDSVAAMTPLAELEGDMEQQFMGIMARTIGKGLRKITGLVSKSGMVVLFINQVREGLNPYGEKVVSPGGNALKFFSSIRLEVNKSEQITGKNADDVIGIRSKIKSIKNKTAAPFRKGVIEIYFDSGLNNFNEYVDFGITFGLIEKAGAWLTYKGERTQGKEKMSNLLKDRSDLFSTLQKEVDSKLSENKEAVLDVDTIDDDIEDEEEKKDEDIISIASEALNIEGE